MGILKEEKSRQGIGLEDKGVPYNAQLGVGTFEMCEKVHHLDNKAILSNPAYLPSPNINRPGEIRYHVEGRTKKLI